MIASSSFRFYDSLFYYFGITQSRSMSRCVETRIYFKVFQPPFYFILKNSTGSNKSLSFLIKTFYDWTSVYLQEAKLKLKVWSKHPVQINPVPLSPLLILILTRSSKPETEPLHPVRESESVFSKPSSELGAEDQKE